MRVSKHFVKKFIHRSLTFKDGVWLQYTPLEGEQSNVTTENGDVVDGILGSQLSDFNNFCELTAESMREEFFGEWHCALHGNHNVKHLGVFHLFETQGDLYVKDVRLPRHVVPESYHIFLHPDLSGEFRVKGNLNLEFKVVEDKENHLQVIRSLVCEKFKKKPIYVSMAGF